MEVLKFPRCRHAKASVKPPGVLAWLASEPFRVFFLAGAVWSIVGVSLWPLFYAGKLDYWPGLVHARIMIEVFGGGFVLGFLGTAGPRMASAPKLTGAELLLLFGWHSATGLSHLYSQILIGDLCFLGMIGTFVIALLGRVIWFRKESPPPQLILAFTGLLCGMAGVLLWSIPGLLDSVERVRLANLLLYQGFLLAPVMGIGSFLFPRILGGAFGEPVDAKDAARKRIRAVMAAILLVASFIVESHVSPMAGYLLRAFVVAGYLLREVPWKRSAEAEPRGTLARALPWCFGLGVVGLTASAFFYEKRLGTEHLLYVGGFGLLMLLVGARVLFGHSGELEGFSRKSKVALTIVSLMVLAATTRASADFWPKIAVSHHFYAAVLWAGGVLLWLLWHRKRFGKKEE
jgi:uncharacterized protein involved in response to NO